MITLSDYQQKAVDWLDSRDGIGLIHGDAGIGKTFIAAGFCVSRGLKKVLILCPATLKREWESELLKFDGTVANIIDGDSEKRELLWKCPDTGDLGLDRFTVANYELLLADCELIRAVPWDAIILDESHYVNSAVAKRTKALKTLEAPVRIALSGDPFPNGELAEAFSIVDWFHPGILGKNFYHFRSRYCRLHPVFRQKIIGYNDRLGLEKIISRFTFRIRKDVLTALPPKRERIVYVRLEEEERKRYYELEHLLRLEVGGQRRLTVPSLLALLMRLRQFLDQPEVFEPSLVSSKRTALEPLLREKGQQEGPPPKTIVFTEFATLAHSIGKQYGAPVVAGDVSLAERKNGIERFRNDPECRLIVMTAAGSYGINATAATRVIHFGVPWNYARVNQRVSRAWRRGQESEVEEIFLLAERTVDEKMYGLVMRKRESQERISGDARKDIRKLLLDGYDDEGGIEAQERDKKGV